jgi:ribose/xylose/arabinose/galactoside ABC-type transport system permease subunit
MSGKNIKKIIIVLLIVAAIVIFNILDLGEYFSLSYIKQSQATFAVMTLAGGALFGLITGTIVVSFASTIGASIACFVSRFILRDWMQGKLKRKEPSIFLQ